MDLDKQLHSLLGRVGWQTCDTGFRQRDWLNKFGEKPVGVALPGSTTEVAEVVRCCRAAKIPIVPQGGNTSLVGGSVLGVPDGIILSLSRMSAISEPDVDSRTIEVEAGVILANLHKALEGTGLMFPMHLGSEGSAQIGGLISTNAGGSHAFRYGMMQDLVLGLEVVLPNGLVWNGMRRVQKDNTGYHLRKIFCGAEGTLGVVTRAVLKLVSAPIVQTTCLLAVPNMAAAVEVAALYRAKAGEFLSALEFFSDIGLEMAIRNIPDLRVPVQQRAPFYVLVEAGAGSSQVPMEEIFFEVTEDSFRAGLILDGTMAMSKAQRNAFWRIREEQPEGQRREGVQLKHDLSVPPRLLGDFLERASSECQSILDGVRINPFGHLGDGNIHYNLSPPIGQNDFSGLEEMFALRLGRLANEMGGSFAAEHGLGQAKVALADQIRDQVERDLMARLKAAFDDDGNFNPGVIVEEQRRLPR